MDAGRRDGASQTLERSEVEALGREAYLISAFRIFVSNNILPRSGGWLDQRQRESANLLHYLNGFNAEQAKPKTQQNKPKPTKEQSKKQWDSFFEQRDLEEVQNNE